MKTPFFAKLILWGSVSLSVVTAGTITLSATGAARITNPELKYSCKFYNYDNTFLYSCKVAPTHNAVYNGPMPERADTLHSRYIFKGWDKTLENITEDVTFHALFQEKKKDYLVSFVNYDGSLLYETYVEAGDVPHYVGDTPTKNINDSYVYTFAGWDKILTQTYENTVYTATFEKAEVFLNTTFLNYDDSVLYQGTVPYNGVAAYNAPTPTKPSNGVVKYTFKGWDKSLYAIVEDTVFKAQYDEEAPTYTVTFVNYDGEFLSSATVNYYESAVYSGPTPRRPSEGTTVYTFIGWDKTFDCVTEDMIVTAQYQSSVPQFTVEFRNYDNSVLGSDVVTIGEEASYDGETPTRPDDDAYTYEFVGWDRELTNVQFDFYTVAVYEATAKTHTVTYLNYDDSVLDTQYVEHGGCSYYQGPWPERPSDEHYEYSFKGWSEDDGYVISDMTIYAEYDLIPIEQSADYPSHDDHGGGGGSDPAPSPGPGPDPTPDPSTHPVPTPTPEEDEEEEPQRQWYYTVFRNHDLSEIAIDKTIATKEPYFDYARDGAKLVRDSFDNDGKHYEFEFQDFTKVPWSESDVEYYIAQYTAQINGEQYYSVCFRNDDQSLIKEYFYKEGQTPTFPDNVIPQPKATEAHRGMVFTGWDKEIHPVTKSITYFATYGKVASVTDGKINVGETSSSSGLILQYQTTYVGDLYFRELSYSDLAMKKNTKQEVYFDNEWLRFNPYNLSDMDYENVISPLKFTADKLKQIDDEYQMDTLFVDNMQHYFTFNPSYMTNDIISSSDSYFVNNYSQYQTYKFIPSNLSVNTINLLKALPYSSEQMKNQEFKYRSFAKNHYLLINDSEVLQFMKTFINTYKLKASNLEQIFDVKKSLAKFATYKKNVTGYSPDVNPIILFLADKQEGDSTHFAAALTCLYRALGVPARYVTGAYTHSNGGLSDLTRSELHAWTEVYIDGVGWVNMDATVDAESGSDPSHSNVYNPFGEVDVEKRLMTVTVSPYDYSRSYNGLPMQVKYSISGSLPNGDYIEVNPILGEKNVGQYVTRATPRVKNSSGVDVTENYVGLIEMVYEEYTINKATIKITTASASKNYDGKALTAHSYEVTNIDGSLASLDEISFEFTGSQTKRGSSPNYVDLSTFTIKNSSDVSVIDNYIVIWEYGKLTVN